MLPSDIAKKIKKIHIKSGKAVNSIMAGQFKSVFKGHGLEFEEVREYLPGDDIKNIDWKVTTRMNHPYIKRYREERELSLMLLVDMSASTIFGTKDISKKENAAQIAGILAFNAFKNNDKVGAILFTDRVEKYIPPKKNSAHIWRLIKEIFYFSPLYKQTDIDSAISFLSKVCNKRVVTFLISDFISPEYSTKLKIASKKHKIVSIILSDDGDFNLPKGGIISFQDFETNTRLVIDASDKNVRLEFEANKQKEYKKIIEKHKSLNIDCIEIKNSDDIIMALTKYFKMKEKRNR
ncbi:MAG: DUF58 domain-containing protein [Desulfobacterales bacterium]|nr:DUF58 domain-containing protein [Desulfobacterales bacterium]